MTETGDMARGVVAFVFAPTVVGEGEVTRLVWLMFDGDEHCVVLCTKSSCIAQMRSWSGRSWSTELTRERWSGAVTT